MGLFGTIVSVFTGKTLRPKDVSPYFRVLSLTNEEVARPHVAGGKRAKTIKKELSKQKSKFRWCGDITVQDLTTKEIKTFDADVRANTKSEARARIKAELPNHRILASSLVRN